MNIQKRGAAWMVHSGELSAQITPALGGKIRRLLFRPRNRNLFFQDPRRTFPRSARGRYLRHDISGFDECFPTVGLSRGPYGQDHGVLWNRPWQAEKQGDRLFTWVNRPGKMPMQCIRRISRPQANRIRLDYTMVNLSPVPQPFIYSSHPILALEPDSRIELPGVKSLSVLGANEVFAPAGRQSWPVFRSASGKGLRLDTGFVPGKKAAGKWFAKCPGQARVSFPSLRRKLVLTWDHRALPCLGLWLSLGIPLDSKYPDPGKWICAALEPCTHPHDLLTAVSRPRQLLPNIPFTFWIQWEITKL